MSLNHGGKRRGAGRPSRTTNARTREIADRAFEEGITPLEVMLDNMRFYHRNAEEALRVLLAGDPKGTEGDNPDRGIIDGIKDVLELRKRAGEEAARAAPYMHTRMGYARDDTNEDPDFVPLADRIKEYERRAKLAGSDDNIIELKRRDDQSGDLSRSEPVLPPIN